MNRRQRNGDNYGTQPDYVEKLVAALRHEEPETTVRAAWVLGRIRDRRAVGPLIDAADRGGDPEFLAAVVEALGNIGDAAACEVVARLAGSSYLKVRLKAVEALAKWDNELVRPTLQAGRHDPNALVREEAARVARGLDATRRR